MKRLITTIILAVCISWVIPTACFADGFNEEDIYNSVFMVSTENGFGSGFAVGENIVLTCSQVVEDAHYIEVTSYSGMVYGATLYKNDVEKDIAIIVTEQSQFSPLTMDKDADLNIGDTIYTIDSSTKYEYKLVTGEIYSKRRVIGDREYIQIEDIIDGTNSGGPLINDQGNVIGINTKRMSELEGAGLSIPIADAIEYLSQEGILVGDNGTEEIAKVNLVEETKAQTNNMLGDSFGTQNDIQTEVTDENIRVGMYLLLTCSLILNIILIICIIIKDKKKEKKQEELTKTPTTFEELKKN